MIVSTPGFTVDVKPYEDGEWQGKYDIYVTDINGNLLMSSRQGYENRTEAEWIAIRLLASPQVIGQFAGVSDPETRRPEQAILNVWGMDGSLVRRTDLR